MTETRPEPHIEVMRVAGRPLRVAQWRAVVRPGQTAARPLLFFNGVGANIEVMAPLAEWFPDRDIITFDMPGVGGSPAPLLPYRAWTMAWRASKLLDKLGYAKVDVMGVSWGGAMAQQFAFQHADGTGKLILAATSAGMLMVPGDPAVLSKMADARRYVDPDYMQKNFQTLYSEAAGADGHILRISPPTPMGYAYQLLAMAGWTSAFFLPFLKCETLVLVGDNDKIVPPVNGKILAGLIPNARLETIPGGHLFLISRAPICAPIMREFLDGAVEMKAAA